MNLGVFVGNLGKDPTVNHQQSTSIVEFSMGVETSRKDQEGKPITLWVSVKSFGKVGQNGQLQGTAGYIMNYLKKGRKVAVHGEIQLETWQNNNGPGAKVVCVANRVEACDPKPQEGQNQGQQQYQGQQQQSYPQQQQNGSQQYGQQNQYSGQQYPQGGQQQAPPLQQNASPQNMGYQPGPNPQAPVNLFQGQGQPQMQAVDGMPDWMQQ